MKNRTLLLAIIMCMLPLENIALATIFRFDDGEVHRIADATRRDHRIWLDSNTLNSPGTHLELVEGGIIDGIFAFKESTVSVTGGIVNWVIDTIGDNTVEITGGSLYGDIVANNNSRVFVSGGYFNEDLYAYDDGIVEVKGGLIKGLLGVYENGTIYLYGNNFSVNGIGLNKGDDLRDYGVIFPESHEYLRGTIQGTLLDKSVLNNDFAIWADSDASIIVIPEPATLSLFIIGVILVEKKRIS